MAPPAGKVMSAKQAVSAFVHDGDHLVIGNYTVGTCAELEKVMEERGLLYG